MKLSKKNRERYRRLNDRNKELVKMFPPRWRNDFLRMCFEPIKRQILPHIKNTVWGGMEQFFFIFDIKRVLGCKRRVITFDNEGGRARFTQKGNQVRLK